MHNCCSTPIGGRSSVPESARPKVVAFVPAKGSSERIENKNAKLLDGRPLVVHTLDKLLKCQNVDEVYLDTESDEIAKLAKHLPVKIMKRSRFLASNGTDGHALFMNEVRTRMRTSTCRPCARRPSSGPKPSIGRSRS